MLLRFDNLRKVLNSLRTVVILISRQEARPNENLNAKKNWLKKTNPVRTTDWKVVVNHYACNRPASWPLNVRQATKIKFT